MHGKDKDAKARAQMLHSRTSKPVSGAGWSEGGGEIRRKGPRGDEKPSPNALSPRELGWVG